MFSKNKLSSAIVGALATSFAVSPVIAQENNNVEEVFVTGIRASLEAAMDVKRESVGVVDAISSEDIGKFPDTNLAESLQRITGVSINRVNGEGAEITVRGFGGGNNMVTLNGRMMPAGGAYGGGSGADSTTKAGGSRAFDFSNLASENVSGVEVFKTSKANIATGGIGATVNIKTTRPLDKPGFRANVGAKAVMDTTNRYNSDITPELSGIVSWTDDNEMFGIAVSGSFQERDSGYTGVTVNDWNIGVWGTDNLFTNSGDVYENAPSEGQLFSRPNDFRYAFSDTQRTRTNGQITFQFAPNDQIVTTLDYTFAKNEVEEQRGEVTNWVQNGSNISRVVFDDSTIATPVLITESYPGTVDIGYEQQFRSQTNELKSVGFNVEFAATDNMSFVFDVHNSTLDSDPTAPGNAGEVAVGLGAPIVTGKTLYFQGEVPTYDLSTNVPGNAITEDHVGSSIGRVRGSGETSEVTQIQLSGALEFDEGRFDFGVETRAMELEAYQTFGENQTLGDWGVANPGEFAGKGLLNPIDVHGEFEDANISRSPSIGFRGNAVDMYKEVVTLYPNSAHLSVSPDFSVNDRIEEDTSSLFAQLTLSAELAGLPLNFVTGFRFETTNSTAYSTVRPLSHLRWENNNDFSAVADNDADLLRQKVKNSYDHLLPNLDIDLSFTENLIGRFSYSKTIARPGYADMRVAASDIGTTGSTYNGTRATANSGNPELIPLESDNFDLSLEWYFSESSYVSGGLFEKRVSNFIGTGQVDLNHYGILDQTSGESERVIQAVNDLTELGVSTGNLERYAVDDTNLYAMIVLNEHPEALAMNKKDENGDDLLDENGNAIKIFPNNIYEATDDQLKLLGETKGWDIDPVSTDPLMIFRTSRPENNREAKIYGGEFAVQHFFGETGFGVQANYTFVNGNVGFNDLALPDETQFALTGLSDTANLVLMYENFGVQARLAYNWRDEFLAESNYKASNNPRYVEAYSQIDMNVSYDITEQLSVSLEGINITGEDLRQRGRNDRMLWYFDDLGARWQAGVRYKF